MRPRAEDLVPPRRGVATRLAGVWVAVCSGCAPTPPAGAPEPASVDTPEPPVPDTPSGRADAPAGFTPAEAKADGCVVRVVELLEAAEYRGAGPMTPGRAERMSADPEAAKNYAAEDHFDHHIQCHYRVEVRGASYRWRHVIDNLTRDLEPSVCETRAAEVADDILGTTRQCTDLHAGEYWGYMLEPL